MGKKETNELPDGVTKPAAPPAPPKKVRDIDPATLSQEESALYIGVKDRKFGELKATGEIPEPVLANRWTPAQWDEYLEQIAAFGSWQRDRHYKRLQALREAG